MTRLMTTSEVVAEPGTDEWYSARGTGIGASEAAAACGLSPYQTPYELYLRKRGELEPFAGNDATVRGTRFEPVILQYAQDELGKELKPGQPPMMRHRELPWILATPDGEFEDGELLECKSSVSDGVMAACGDEGTDEVPTPMLLQCQQQMLVTGAEVVHLAIVIPDRWKFFRFQTYKIDRHDKLINLLIRKERELWQMIEAGTPPEPDWSHATTIDVIKAAHGAPAEDAGTIALTSNSCASWNTYERLGKQIRELEADRQAERAKVLHEIGDNYAGMLDDGRMVRRKLIEKQPHMVKASSYVDVRAVKGS